MKTCSQISQLLSEAQDRNLLLTEKFAAQTHLMICRGCRDYKNQLGFLREALRVYADTRLDKKNPDA